jgi:hypothetical protein
MSSVSIEQLRAEFAKHDLMLLQKFANLLLPSPTNDDRTFKIKTSDGFDYYVWGKDAEEVLNRLHRFLRVRVFV